MTDCDRRNRRIRLACERSFVPSAPSLPRSFPSPQIRPRSLRSLPPSVLSLMAPNSRMVGAGAGGGGREGRRTRRPSPLLSLVEWAIQVWKYERRRERGREGRGTDGPTDGWDDEEGGREMGWDSLVLTASRFKGGRTAAAPRSPCTARPPRGGYRVCAQRYSACGSSDARQPAAPGRARASTAGLIRVRDRSGIPKDKTPFYSARYPKNTGGRRKMDG